MADDLKVKVKLEVDNDIDTSKVKKTAETAGKEVGENVNKWMAGAVAKWVAIWDTIKAAIQKVWNMTKQFISDSISLANSYESAFAWVKKTVNWTEKEMRKLDNNLKKLAKEIPMTYQDLAKIMELWWQLGVQTKNLDKFTKAVAQLGTATNLTSEDAAQMLAQFANITQMDLNDIDRLWSVIVDLGNNFATTESDIVSFAQRIAGAGQIAWISQANIMAIATAFSSVGIEAEAWGTAVQKVLLDMNSAVTTWSDQLQTYAKILWITTEEFKKLYQEHPEEVFVKFVESLQGAGQEAQLLLDELWLNDQRLVRGFLSLSQNADLLTDAINRSNDAWANNVALSAEAEQRYSTTESQILMQQNERANMMAAIWEKLQDIVLMRENVKTTFVNAIGSFIGVTMESSDATEALEAEIRKVIWLMNDLDQQLQNGEITIEEWAKQRIKLEEDAKAREEALKKEKKRLKELDDAIEYATWRMAYYSNQYEFLIKNREKYSYTWEQEAERMKKYYNDWQNELENLMIVQEAWIELTDEEIEERKKQKEFTAKLTQAEQDLKAAKEEYNNLKSDDSATRAELEASRKKVAELTKAYDDLKNSMASVWIAKSMKSIDFQTLREKSQKIFNDLKNKAWGGTWGGGTGGSEDNGGTVWENLFWWKSKGGGWWKSKSKAEDMAESLKEEMKSLYNEIDSTVSEHQKNYEKIVENIEDVEKEYEDLRKEAKKTWEDAEDALRDYNEELEKSQTEAVTSLWQRYVELRRDLIETDTWLKEMAENVSWKTLQAYQDRWESEYEGYNLKDLMSLKEKLDEIKLIEENTTEEQRKSVEFTQKTSKAQEILNDLKEKEAELEEKKAIAIEKQAIAQAMMDQENWKNYIRTLTKDGEDIGTWYYNVAEEKRQQIQNLENIEYAKQLETQSTNLNDQLKQYQEEKDNEVEILTTINSRKSQLEAEYTKTFQEEVAKQKASIDELITRWDVLLAKKEAYYWTSISSRRAYGWELDSGVTTLVGENGPEAIVARTASYVQPRNASNTYSTVNNNQSSFSINGMNINVNSIDDFLGELKQRMTYRD